MHVKPIEHKILSNEETTEDSRDKRGSNNVFFRLNEAAKRKVTAAGTSPNNKSSSEYDCTLTQDLKKALGLLEIKVVDHIVVGGAEYYSFSEHGLI